MKKKKENEEEKIKYEAIFRLVLKEKLKGKFNEEKYTVEEGEKLIYKVFVRDNNGNLEFDPQKPTELSDYVFEADLVIKEEKIPLPLVVIETKYKSFTTHDVITYSTKALRHKEIYPYLRYGLVVAIPDKNEVYIAKKFFTHNVGFDFALAMKISVNKSNDKSLKEISEKLSKKQQLEKNEMEGLKKVFKIDKNDLKMLKKILQNQIKSAENLKKVIFDEKKKIKKYCSIIEINSEGDCTYEP